MLQSVDLKWQERAALTPGRICHELHVVHSQPYYATAEEDSPMMFEWRPVVRLHLPPPPGTYVEGYYEVDWLREHVLRADAADRLDAPNYDTLAEVKALVEEDWRTRDAAARLGATKNER